MWNKVKKVRKLINIRAFYRSRIKLLENINLIDKLKKSYAVFSTLSKNSYIDEIKFVNGNAVIQLSDERKYYFNPHSKIDMLYSVPQIGTFEPKETNIVSKIVSEGDYCLDIGGSFGWYTVLLSKIVGQKGRVFSFEPIKQNYLSHNKNIELNMCRNVISNNLAVGEEPGEIEIYLSDVDTSGSLKLRKYKDNYETQITKLVKLDDYFTENKIEKLDFIKIDIEGAELGALKGGEKILNKFKPVLFVEIQSHSTELFGYKPEDIFNYLYNLGYKSYIISNNSLERFEFKEPLTEYNFFFKM